MLCVLVGLGLALWRVAARAAREEPGSGRLEGLAPEAGPGTSGKVALGTRAAAPGSAEAPTHAPGEWPASLADADPDLDLCGVVVDASGRAIAGAALSTWSRRWSTLPDLPPFVLPYVAGPRTESGPDGAFRLRLDRGDPVCLVAQAAGSAPCTRASCYAGQRLRVVLGPGAMLRLRAFDRGGRPAPGVRLRVEVDPLPVREVPTNEAGEALAGPVGVGSNVHVSVPYQARWSAADYGAERQIPQGCDEVAMDVVVEPPAPLGGRVTDAITGAPVEGASVGLGFEHVDPVATDAQGRFLHAWVPPDRDLVLISVRAPGYAVRILKPSALLRFRGSMEPHPHLDLDVPLMPEFRVVGRVVQPDGTPGTGAIVLAVCTTRLRPAPNAGRGDEDGEPPADAVEVSSQEASPAADGSFRIRGLDPAGTTIVSVTARGHAAPDTRIEPGPTAGSVHDVGTIVLAPARQIAGRVVGTDGVPRQHVEVQAFAAMDFHSALTDTQGRFCFGGLGPGAWILRMNARGWMAGRIPPRSVTVEAKDVLDVTLVLPDARRVLLDLVDGEERRVEMEHGRVRWEGGWDTAGPLPAEDPSLYLPPGARGVELEVLEASREDVALPARFPIPDGVETFAAQLARAHPLRGRVQDPEGYVVSDACVEALRGGEVVAVAQTGELGHFRLAVPGPEPVDLRCHGHSRTGEEEEDSYYEWAAQATAVPPGSEDVILRGVGVPQDGVLRLQVFAPDGMPAVGCIVELVWAPSGPRNAPRTDAQGRVQIAELARRPRRVVVRVPAERALEWFAPDLGALLPQETEHLVRLVRPRLLRVAVLDAHGASAPGAFLTATDLVGDSTRWVAQAVTDQEGVAFLPLDPQTTGWVRLRARLPGPEPAPWTDPVFVGPGTDEVVLRLGAR